MTIGDAFFNSTMQSISVQLEDGATLVDVTIKDAQGGVQYVVQGNVRGASVASRSNEYNLDVSGMNLVIGKGYKIFVQTVTA